MKAYEIPLYIPRAIAVIALFVGIAIVLAILFLGVRVVSLCATLTFSRTKHRLLRQLHRIGKPDQEIGVNDDPPCHDHGPACTPQTCPIRQEEEYQRLEEACQAAGVKPWRIVWATA